MERLEDAEDEVDWLFFGVLSSDEPVQEGGGGEGVGGGISGGDR